MPARKTPSETRAATSGNRGKSDVVSPRNKGGKDVLDATSEATVPRDRRKLEITISWGTILKVIVACALTGLAIKLWPLLALLLLSLLIAITLFPILRWVRRRGWPDWSGILLIGILLFVSVGLFVGVLIPTIGNEGAELIKRLPTFQQDVVTRMPEPLRDAANKLFESASFSNPEPLLKQFLGWGTVVVEGMGQFLVVLVLAIYLVADGERVYRWLLAFLPERQRRKVAKAAPEVGVVVSSYMIGQLITSVLCGVFAFTLLSILHVSNAALLAVIAAVFDILPLIGFFLAIIPALVIAASNSLGTAGLVLLLYGAYHLVETYFIVPKVYGDRLRLSTLTVLVSCMAAGLVAGIVGAIVILPLVASYPIVERIWLRRHLEDDTVTKHDQIDAEEHAAA
jgi:predicted PurR-regulated permease PerM